MVRAGALPYMHAVRRLLASGTSAAPGVGAHGPVPAARRTGIALLFVARRTELA